VVKAPTGIVFEFTPVYAALGALESVVTVAVMVQLPRAGIVPPVIVTVRVGAPPGRVTTPPTQVVVGVPVNLRLLLGIVGRVSEILTPV
jgi:hypothetical protein